jgi:ABC-type nitrate/sulfonate/bicarbonate transport system substrate-binding protein
MAFPKPFTGKIMGGEYGCNPRAPCAHVAASGEWPLRNPAATARYIRAQVVALGYDLVASTPQEFATRIAAEIEMWARVIRAANIKAE